MIKLIGYDHLARVRRGAGNDASMMVSRICAMQHVVVRRLPPARNDLRDGLHVIEEREKGAGRNFTEVGATKVWQIDDETIYGVSA